MNIEKAYSNAIRPSAKTDSCSENDGMSKSVGALGKVCGSLPSGRYDAHTHVITESATRGHPDPESLKRLFIEGGLTGGCVFSEDPNRWYPQDRRPKHDALKAIENVIEWCSALPTLYPFYWVDPFDPKACDNVDLALSMGIYGFKVISSKNYPCNECTMKVYHRIAEAGKPITFHSGILWDGHASSEYLHPAFFEKLIDVPKLRFSLAHVSWPWVDECIAVYGKFYATSHYGYRSDPVGEMFIDTTRGTPDLYRKDALTKIYKVGYEVDGNVMFGTDMWGGITKSDVPLAHVRKDDAVFAELGLADNQLDAYYRRALERFLFGD